MPLGENLGEAWGKFRGKAPDMDYRTQYPEDSEDFLTENDWYLDEADIESLRQEKNISKGLKDKIFGLLAPKKVQQRNEAKYRQLQSQVHELRDTLKQVTGSVKTISHSMDPKNKKRDLRLRVPVPKFAVRAIMTNGRTMDQLSKEEKANHPKYELEQIYSNKMFDNAFPKICFTGDKKNKLSPSIRNFLESMNHGQEMCFLTEEDFKTVLSRKILGDACSMVSRWINLKFSVADIYYNLLKIYSSEPEPDVSQRLLVNYRPPKGLTWSEIQQEIEELARSASLTSKTVEDQNQQYNTLGVLALRQCLPHNSTRYVEEEIARYRNMTGGLPDFFQLTDGLKDFDAAIENDLRHPPPNYRFGRPRAFMDFTSKGFDYGFQPSNGRQQKAGHHQGLRVNQIGAEHGSNVHTNAIQGPSGAPKANSGKNNYQQHGAPTPSNPRVSGGKKYCSLCGQNNHNAADGCESIRDNRGKLVEAAVSTGACNNCIGKLQYKLFHNEAYCPIREEMLVLYDQGLRPRGRFAKYYYGLKRSTQRAFNRGQRNGKSSYGNGFQRQGNGYQKNGGNSNNYRNNNGYNQSSGNNGRNNNGYRSGQYRNNNFNNNGFNNNNNNGFNNNSSYNSGNRQYGNRPQQSQQ